MSHISSVFYKGAYVMIEHTCIFIGPGLPVTGSSCRSLTAARVMLVSLCACVGHMD